MRAEHITVCYGEKTVLKDFSAEFAEYGCTCIMGANGCGKTTLLRVLAGLISPQEGRIFHALQPVAYLFQDDRLLPWLSVSDNLIFFNGKENQVETNFWLERFGLEKNDKRMPKQLSGGMRQRAALAVAFSANSRLLLLDEPYRGIDRAYSDVLKGAIQEQKEKKAIVLVTHEEECAEYLADCVIRM
ncbi:MAG: ATP-binding cassette domain-containing protein [Clostridiales bacterium]|nr:ATP-binding cassette domain-containing protein [Clostridiales bacterium]